MTREQMKGMQLPKPQRYPNLDEMRKLQNENKLYIQRKRDGQRHVIFIGENGAELYDRSLRQIFHFEELLAAFNEENLPVGTLLDIEITIDVNGNADDFSSISSLNKAGLEVARRIIRNLESKPKAMMLDVLWLGDIPTYQLPFEARHTSLVEMFGDSNSIIYVTENLEGTVDECMQLAIANKWEGLIFWHRGQATKIGYGKTIPRLNSWKWKNTKEEDFICTGWEGTSATSGPMLGVVGALNLVEVRNGELAKIGGVGTGLTLMERQEAVSWTYPCVVQVVYDERTPIGALRFPRFVRQRPDKTMEEVMMESGLTSNIEKDGNGYSPRGHKG